MTNEISSFVIKGGLLARVGEDGEGRPELLGAPQESPRSGRPPLDPRPLPTPLCQPWALGTSHLPTDLTLNKTAVACLYCDLNIKPFNRLASKYLIFLVS